MQIQKQSTWYEPIQYISFYNACILCKDQKVRYELVLKLFDNFFSYWLSWMSSVVNWSHRLTMLIRTGSNYFSKKWWMMNPYHLAMQLMLIYL